MARTKGRASARATRHAASGRPGIVDVAALAGVSHITVSRVLNAHPSVSDDTQRRVREALRSLGYKPNHAARALVTGRSATIGVICHNTTLYGSSAALLGLEQAASAQGYFVSLLGVASFDRRAVENAVQRLRQQAVAGIVVMAPQAAMADAFRRSFAGIPSVSIWGHAAASIPRVTSSETFGSRLATRHLLELGHRSVAHLAGPEDRVSTQERLRGWREVLKEHGIHPPRPLHGDWSAQSGYFAAKRMLADRSISAIFVANDQMALGVLRAIVESGRAVPRDVSVVGFDDIPDAAYFCPPLTTIRQDFPRLGRTAFQLILDTLNGRAVDEVPMLPVELVVRASSAAPPGS